MCGSDTDEGIYSHFDRHRESGSESASNGEHGGQKREREPRSDGDGNRGDRGRGRGDSRKKQETDKIEVRVRKGKSQDEREANKDSTDGESIVDGTTASKIGRPPRNRNAGRAQVGAKKDSNARRENSKSGSAKAEAVKTKLDHEDTEQGVRAAPHGECETESTGISAHSRDKTQ